MNWNRIKRPLPILSVGLFFMGIILFQNCGGSFKMENLTSEASKNAPVSPTDSSSLAADIPPEVIDSSVTSATCEPILQTLFVSNITPNVTATLANTASPLAAASSGVYLFVVPQGVASITVKAWGGGGGSSGGNFGGGGAYVTGRIAVTPGETLEVGVAQGGQAQSQMQNHLYGGGGGGMSYIQRVSNGQMILIAAGGGGSGLDGNSGLSSTVGNGSGGAGGAATGFPGGNASGANRGSGAGGGGGSQMGPGAGGSQISVTSDQTVPSSGLNGGLFLGGHSNTSVNSGGNRWNGGAKTANGSGGGGGAGLYGGGSGSYLYTYWGAGGGGGSSYIIPSAKQASMIAGQGRIVGNAQDPLLPTGHGNGGLNGVSNDIIENQGVPMAGQPGYMHISW